jgi:hypothetical protein
VQPFIKFPAVLRKPKVHHREKYTTLISPGVLYGCETSSVTLRDEKCLKKGVRK